MSVKKPVINNKNNNNSTENNFSKTKIVPKNTTKRYVWHTVGKLVGYDNITKSLKQENLILRDSERNALVSYIGVGYININRYMRNGEVSENDKVKTIQSIRSLKNLFDRVPPLEQDIVVRRVQKQETDFNIEENGSIPLSEKDKPRVRVKGFLSTSGNSHSSEDFGMSFSAGKKFVEYKIIVPKGIKALDVRKLAPKSKVIPGEDEIIIQDNTVLVIDSIKYDEENNKKIVLAHIEPAYTSSST